MNFFRNPIVEFSLIALTVIGFFIFALPVRAADPHPGLYRPLTTQHGTHSANGLAATNATQAGVDIVRLFCVTACYYSMAVTNGKSVATLAKTILAANLTTHYLPANVAVEHNVGPGIRVIVISVSTGGAFHFTEMSK